MLNSYSSPPVRQRFLLPGALLALLLLLSQAALGYTITTSVQGGTSFCAGSAVRVPYAVDQPFASGNVFTAQLSDDSGSFANPVMLGSLAGTSNGTIQGTLPAATPAGTGYRIRVVASTPATVGTDNGTDLTINNLGPLTAGANTPLCVGDNLLLTASLVPGASYAWTGPAGFTSQLRNPTIPNVALNRSGTYTVTAAANGCTVSAQVVVMVSALPVVSIAPNTPVICSGSSVQLTATGGVSYAWSPSTGLSSTTIANPVAAPTASTIYTVTATNASGCTNTSQVTVTVRATPAVSVSPAAPTVCAGSSVTLAATGAQNYQWSPTAGLSNPNAANPVASPTQTTTYTVTGTSNGCTSTASVTVTVEAAPTANAGPPQVLCSGQTTTLGTAPVAGLSYSWSPSTGLSSTTVAQPTLTATNTTNAARITTYTLTVVSATGCVGSSSTQVTVNPAVVATPGPALSLCPGQPGQLGAASVAGVSYSWSPTTGLSSATIANPTVTLPNAGTTPLTQTYTLTASRNGCQSTGTVVVTVNPTQNAGFSYGATVLCTGAGNPTPTRSSPTTAGTFSATPTGLVFVSTTTGQLDATASTPGTYTISYTTGGPCASTSTATVTFTNAPSAAFQYASATYCLGGGTAIPVLANGASGGTYSATPTGLTLNASTGAIDLTSSTAGTYTVTNTVGSSGTCSATASTTVTLTAGAVVAVSASQPTLCAGQSTTLTATGGLTYSYSGGGQTYTGATITVMPTATTTYTVTGTTAQGCTSTASITVTVNPVPVLTAGASVAAVCAGQSAVLAASGASSFSWTGGGQTYTGATVTVTPTQTTTYTVTGTNASGCQSTTQVTVAVNALPTVTLALPSTTLCTSAAPVTLSGGSPAGGTYSGPGVAGGVFSPGSTGPGTYTITYAATNAQGCANTATQQLTVVAPPTVTATASQPTVCAGQPTTLTFSGASSYTVTGGGQTLTGASVTVMPTTTTTYTVAGSNVSGCAGIAQVTVMVNPAPAVALAAFPNAACSQGTPITLSGGSPAGGVYAGPGVSNGVFSPATVGAGTYTITYTVTSAQGCSATATQPLTVSTCLATSPAAPTPELALAPNPSTGLVMLTLSGPLPATALAGTVFNVLGQPVQQLMLPASVVPYALDLHTLANGVYLLRLNLGQGQWLTRRLVLAH